MVQKGKVRFNGAARNTPCSSLKSIILVNKKDMGLVGVQELYISPKKNFKKNSTNRPSLKKEGDSGAWASPLNNHGCITTMV